MHRILIHLTESSRQRVFLDTDFERLAALGELVYFDPSADDPSRFFGLIRGVDAMLTCWGSLPLTAELLGERTSTLCIAHAAGAVRGICPKALLGPSVRLTQGAGAIAVAVAQYTVGLMVLALRQTIARAERLKRGEKANDGAYYDLENVTVGLIGLSRVGSRVAELLPPFGPRVLAYDPYCTPERASALGVTLVSDLDTLIAQSDLLSLHAPVLPETRGLLDARRVALLRDGAVVINTARAELVDQDALFARALAGTLTYYADVTTPEPLPNEHPAFGCTNIFLTPHIAGPTRQTVRRMADTAISEIARFLNNQPLLWEVTPERYEIVA